MSNRARSDIQMFASGIQIHPADVRIVYVRPFSHPICQSIYVKIVLIMKDDGLADENVGWSGASQVSQNRLKDFNLMLT